MGADARAETRIEEHISAYLGAALLDDSLRIEAISDGIVAIGSYDRDALVGGSVLNLLHPDDLERAAWELQELANTESPATEGMFRIRLADTSFTDVAIRASAVAHAGERKTVLKFSTVSRAVRAQEFARATVDTLRLMSEPCELEECLEQLHRLAERHVSGIRLVISTIQHGGTHTHRRLPNHAFQVKKTASAPLPSHVEKVRANHTQGPRRAFNRMSEFEQTSNGALITSIVTDDRDEVICYVEATRTTTTEPDHQEWMVHGLVRQVLTAVVRRNRLEKQLNDATDKEYP